MEIANRIGCLEVKRLKLCNQSLILCCFSCFQDFVRQEAFILLHNALEGCGGTAAATAYAEAYRLITRFSTLDKSLVVRIAAARCLKAFSNIGGPGLGTSEFDTLASYCLKVSLMCE